MIVRTCLALALATTTTIASSAPRGVYLLKEGTDVTVTNRVELSSKTAHVGDRFDVEVAEAVKVGAATVIPAGTLGVAEVTVADKSGHIGKSGKLEVRVLYLKLGETHVPVYGQFNQEGEGGTAGAIGATVVAGPFGLLVKGKSAIIKPGTQMHVFIKENTSLAGQ